MIFNPVGVETAFNGLPQVSPGAIHIAALRAAVGLLRPAIGAIHVAALGAATILPGRVLGAIHICLGLGV
jgi:hypothetical protein